MDIVPRRAQSRNEAEFERAVCVALHHHRIQYRRQVACPTGIIDVLTTDAVIELKDILERRNFAKAIGQVLLYRNSVAPKAKAVILFRESFIRDYAPAAQLGVICARFSANVFASELSLIGEADKQGIRGQLIELHV